MAGYIVKITIEDTHPPVWRRVLLPEKITFADLNEIIQILFGWDGEYQHEFTIPSEHIKITGKKSLWYGRQYLESETLIEELLFENKWIRYTYDFGNDWRHKIVYEKSDEAYEERYARLLKYRGDNFEEDSVRVWASEEGDVKIFDDVSVRESLSKLEFPVREGLSAGEDSSEDNFFSLLDGKGVSEEFIENLLRGFTNLLAHSMKRRARGGTGAGKHSAMVEKGEKWNKFIEKWNASPEESNVCEKEPEYVQMTLPIAVDAGTVRGGYTFRMEIGEKTQRELLCDLSMKETEDYCRYLRVAPEDWVPKNQLTNLLADTFRTHPEYFLYVINREEYQELLEWLKEPDRIIKEPIGDSQCIWKMIEMGLADFSVRRKKGCSNALLSFAADIQELLSPLTPKLCKEVYREINDFSEKFRKILVAYGMMDTAKLYEIYQKIYHRHIEEERFLRFMYWHESYLGRIRTFSTMDGKKYAALSDVEVEKVYNKMLKYAGDMEYAAYSARDIEKYAEDAGAGTIWSLSLHDYLVYYLGFSAEKTKKVFIDIMDGITNGDTLPEAMEKVVEYIIADEMQLVRLGDFWEVMAGLMLEQRLIILKGWNRFGFADEAKISPWQIGMIEKEQMQTDSKECHMYCFPAEIQELMYEAIGFASQDALEELWAYRGQNKIQSEEFLYLLAMAYVRGCNDEKAEILFRKLEKSSDRGRYAAEELRAMLKLENGLDVFGDYDDEDFEGDYEEALVWNTGTYNNYGYFGDVEPQRPYVREMPKIGRNDPCPCGSGKKYKKCCGKNN